MSQSNSGALIVISRFRNCIETDVGVGARAMNGRTTLGILASSGPAGAADLQTLQMKPIDLQTKHRNMLEQRVQVRSVHMELLRVTAMFEKSVIRIDRARIVSPDEHDCSRGRSQLGMFG